MFSTLYVKYVIWISAKNLSLSQLERLSFSHIWHRNRTCYTFYLLQQWQAQFVCRESDYFWDSVQVYAVQGGSVFLPRVRLFLGQCVCRVAQFFCPESDYFWDSVFAGWLHRPLVVVTVYSRHAFKPIFLLNLIFPPSITEITDQTPSPRLRSIRGRQWPRKVAYLVRPKDSIWTCPNWPPSCCSLPTCGASVWGFLCIPPTPHRNR